MARVTVLQQRIGEHLAERRRDIHREARLSTGLVQRLKNENQRKIDLGDRLVKPVFFKKFRIFRMPDKRQVSVEDQAEISDGHDLVSGQWWLVVSEFGRKPNKTTGPNHVRSTTVSCANQPGSTLTPGGAISREN